MGSCKSGGKGAGTGASANSSALSKSEMDRVSAIPDDEKKDFYYQINLNQSTANYLNSPDANTRNWARDSLKDNTVLVNESMPTLNGSDKQVAWAKNIRDKAINNQINSIISRLPVANGDYSKRDAFMSMAQQKFNVNINSFSDAVNKLISEDPNGAFYFFKNTTSASAIISSKYR